GAVTTSYPAGTRSASTRRRFSGVSSIARTLRRSVMLHASLALGCRSRSSRMNRSALVPSYAPLRDRVAHLLGERSHVDRLRDEAVEARLIEALAIFLHDGGSHRDDRDARRLRILAQVLERGDAVHARELDVHEHELRRALLREDDAIFGVGGLERCDADAGVLHVELHVLVLLTDAHLDAAAIRRELRGVGEQVVEDLLHLPFVGLDPRKVVWQDCLERDAVARRALAHDREAVLDRC